MTPTSVSPLAALFLSATLAVGATAPAMAQQPAPAATVSAGATAPAPAEPTPAPAASDTTTAPNPVRPAPALGVPAAPYSNASAGGGLMQTTLALFFVIALLLGGAWVLKRFGPRGFGGGSNTVKLVGALSVGARERILVVEVGEQWIVVGASPGSMNALATMPRQETPDTAVGGQPMAAPANFADWFKQTIDKRNGNHSKQ